MQPIRYKYYRALIPMSWNYTRPNRLMVRCSDETLKQLADIRHMMNRANPSQADAVAWAVSLLHAHMRHQIDPSLIDTESKVPILPTF